MEGSMSGVAEDPDVFAREGRTFNGSDGPDLPLTIDEWLARDLPEPDFLLGSWLSTSSRAMLVAATGIGKTNFAIATAIAISAGSGFLHWPGRRPARVLFIDGEMSRRLLRQRLRDAVRRIGSRPEGLLTLSHEDIPGFAPLNTTEGQAKIEAIIEQHGPFDLIVFDNIMCLIDGDQRDEEGWRQILPWVLSLTRRSIGQLWVHHTGHDETRSYGTKVREWQMDTVGHMTAFKRNDTDISFDMTFKKARERSPATRTEFDDVQIALVDDAWTFTTGGTSKPKRTLSAKQQLALDILSDLAIDGKPLPPELQMPTSIRAVPAFAWRTELESRGVLDKESSNPRARWQELKTGLLVREAIGERDGLVWKL
jgi:hypothetical protein